MTVLAVDPGYEQSAWVLYDGLRVLSHGIERNDDMLVTAFTYRPQRVEAVVFEQIESYGMAVGREVFETVFWTGRFFERACGTNALAAGGVHRMPRKAVKLHLCHSARAQDTNIRAALMDRFGGSKAAAIGIKAAPGPLFGIKSHEWSALAIAVTWWDQQAPKEATA